jgi:hypothetical protein
MPRGKAKGLIADGDQDYEISCKFWLGTVADNPSEFIADAHNEEVAIMERTRFQNSWYDKLPAAFAEEKFPERIQSMRNRFAIEGLGDNDLNAPVSGLEARKTILKIADELWMLAYKVRAKEISLEKDGIPQRF